MLNISIQNFRSLIGRSSTSKLQLIKYSIPPILLSLCRMNIFHLLGLHNFSIHFWCVGRGSLLTDFTLGTQKEGMRERGIGLILLCWRISAMRDLHSIHTSIPPQLSDCSTLIALGWNSFVDPRAGSLRILLTDVDGYGGLGLHPIGLELACIPDLAIR